MHWRSARKWDLWADCLVWVPRIPFSSWHERYDCISHYSAPGRTLSVCIIRFMHYQLQILAGTSPNVMRHEKYALCILWELVLYYQDNEMSPGNYADKWYYNYEDFLLSLGVWNHTGVCTACQIICHVNLLHLSQGNFCCCKVKHVIKVWAAEVLFCRLENFISCFSEIWLDPRDWLL